MAETTRNHIFSKEISQVLIAAMVLAPISIEKIVCEWFQLWEETRLNDSIRCVSHLYADDTVLLCASPDAILLNSELN